MHKPFFVSNVIFALLLMSCTTGTPRTGLITNSRTVTQQSVRDFRIQDLYPIQENRPMVFQLTQTEDGSPQVKQKVLKMWFEQVSASASETSALLKRSQSDQPADKQSPPTLVRVNAQQVEMSRVPAALHVAQDAEPAKSLITLKGPLELNQSWPGRPMGSGQETIRVAGFETIQVPAGRFETVLIEHRKAYADGREDILRYWYAPGQGMVKMYEELSFYFGKWLKFRSTGERLPDSSSN